MKSFFYFLENKERRKSLKDKINFYQLIISLYIVASFIHPSKVILIIILLICEFFTAALAHGFQLEPEWQQVSSSLKNSSEHSGQSQQCCSLDDLHLSSYFQVIQSLYQSFGNRAEGTNYNCYHRHFHFIISQVMSSLFISFFFFSVLLGGPPEL